MGTFRRISCIDESCAGRKNGDELSQRRNSITMNYRSCFTVVDEYRDLYNFGRTTVMDGLRKLPSMEGQIALQDKIMIVVLLLSHKLTVLHLEGIMGNIEQLLYRPVSNNWQMEDNPEIQALQQQITAFLTDTSTTFNLNEIEKAVTDKLMEGLVEFEEVGDCLLMRQFISRCVRFNWRLKVCHRLLSYKYSESEFSALRHVRHSRANPENEMIHNFLWPTIIDSRNAKTVFHGIVIT